MRLVSERAEGDGLLRLLAHARLARAAGR